MNKQHDFLQPTEDKAKGTFSFTRYPHKLFYIYSNVLSISSCCRYMFHMPRICLHQMDHNLRLFEKTGL